MRWQTLGQTRVLNLLLNLVDVSKKETGQHFWVAHLPWNLYLTLMTNKRVDKKPKVLYCWGSSVFLARASWVKLRASRDPSTVEFTSTHHRPNSLIILLFIYYYLLKLVIKCWRCFFLAKFIVPETGERKYISDLFSCDMTRYNLRNTDDFSLPRCNTVT